MKLELSIFNEENITDTLCKFDDKDVLRGAVDRLKNMVGNAWFFEQCELSQKYDVSEVTEADMLVFEEKSSILEDEYMDCLERVDKVFNTLAMGL